MSITWQALYADEIPEHIRREGLDVIFKVVCRAGHTYYWESGDEAALLVISLNEQHHEEAQDREPG